MHPYEFAYWLNGYFELSNSNNLSEEQVKTIKEHLQKVFFSSGTSGGSQMHPDEFVYWLKDYFELNNSNLSEEQVRTIKENLQKVFSNSSGTSGIQAFSGTC
jgi:cell division protein FtsI/penicillin-binding protein 2